MKILILSLFLAVKSYAYQPVVTIEYDVIKKTQTDILFVIDNSGSMGMYQNTLTEINNVLFDELGENDFKITAISTDESGRLNNYVVDRKVNNPVEELRKLIKSFGINGSASEVPFSKVISFYSSEIGDGFFRQNSTREIIILTDEDDQSEEEVTTINEFIAESNSVVSALALDPKNTECVRYDDGAIRISNVVNYTGGIFIDICSNNSRESLVNEYRELAAGIARRAKLSAYAISPIKELKLHENSNIDSLEVYYGSQIIKRGYKQTGWIYDEKKNKIIFGNQIVLNRDEPAETKFTIQYSIL